MLVGKNAAVVYGSIATMSALIPPVIWFADRKPKVDALKKNGLYWWSWLSLWLGHLLLYSFPGLFWPISFAAYPMFNTFYVMWAQYGTFIVGGLLNLLVMSLFFISYFIYEDEAGLDKDRILTEALVYTGISALTFGALYWKNEMFQRFYQTIYSTE